jgi:large subunit ribosomal protein L3
LYDLAGKNRKKMKGIIGKKIGMTSIFDPGGKQIACTIIEAGPCVVTQVKTQESDGYSALQLSFGDKKESRTTLAEKNHFAKANTAAKKIRKCVQ